MCIQQIAPQYFKLAVIIKCQHEHNDIATEQTGLSYSWKSNISQLMQK